MRDHCFGKGGEAWPIDVPAKQPHTCPAKEGLNLGGRNEDGAWRKKCTDAMKPRKK